MKQKMLKALVILDSGENSWFLNGGFHESIDCHLVDVKGLRVNLEDSQGTLLMIAKHHPDVLMLDSTLARNYAFSMVSQVREKIPNLPVVLLPDIHCALEQAQDLSLAAGDLVGLGSRIDNVLDSGLIAADTIARTIRYTHRPLGLTRA